MILPDYHIHTSYSFDGGKGSTVENICLSAINKGLTHIAITDHFECNSDFEGCYAPYDVQSAYLDILQAKEKFKGVLNIAYGMEIGQASQYPEVAKELLSEYPVEFVLASLHNIRGKEDFYFMDFSDMPQEQIYSLVSLYIDEVLEVLSSLDRIDSLAHITYPYRYIAQYGRGFDFSPFYDRLSKIFEIMTGRDIALEVNVSTHIKGCGFTLPDRDILSLYRECGGELVTVGSDSHTPDTVGLSAEYACELLRGVDLHKILITENGEKKIITLN